jgi:hypothetical protein
MGLSPSMETLTYDLSEIVPISLATGVKFARLEIPKYESLALGLVWYTIWDEHQERGARIDLQKQAFLDDFGEIERGKLNAEARLVVNFISSLSTRQALASHMAPAAMRELEKISDPWQR